ncbi:MAG: hypothetical protein EPO09_17755 [Aquabacterium sp.]|uniref:SGNH/GDSL hydrolase family protein n=1 Tax=Aquabacterium sp. TaxID=1872578 RepID=UPI001229F2B4|nr:SGNH/GDSL hydrolase family protein [Aquabacterium sp.]TAK88735.1 MAG: hypothetical protein EPO09_17755 [Aquabacterium sp.]
MFRFAAASSKPSTLAQTVIRLGAVAAACSALTWSLSGCGGGSRAREYVPDSVVSFGDENSAMVDSASSTSLDPAGSTGKRVQGLVYTVNAVIDESLLGVFTYCTDGTANQWCNGPVAPATATPATPISFSATSDTFTTGGAPHAYYFDTINTGNTSNVVTFVDVGTGTVSSVAKNPLKRTYNVTYACSTSRLWNQVVAHSFGKGFESACALDLDGAKTYAAQGAMVADLQTQVSAHRAELHDGVLVTIMIGQNDILDVYNSVVATPALDASAASTLGARGRNAAAIVQSVLNTGAKVVLALTPDLGESPMAAALDATGKARLKAYTSAFNDGLKFGMGSTAAQDGRHFALVESDLYTNPITRSASYVHGAAVCDMSATFKRPDGSNVLVADADYATRVQYCNANTLVTNGSVSTYMWADDTHFAPAGHAQIGSLAASRVYNQF